MPLKTHTTPRWGQFLQYDYLTLMRLLLGLKVVELDLGSIVPSLSGPKLPHDQVEGFLLRDV